MNIDMINEIFVDTMDLYDMLIILSEGINNG